VGVTKGRPTAAILGLGLVGGSLARALSKAGWRVLGVDRAPIFRRARSARVVATPRLGLREAVEEADIVVLAAPPEANLALLRRLSDLGTRAVITDVGSVKGPICREARRLGLRAFVGGHPMAGTEGSGFGASSRDLFRGRVWVLTGAPSLATRTVRSMVAAVGARAYSMKPEDHDRAVAFLSHLPQMASWALLAAAVSDPVARKHQVIAGPGFRDMTRLAASPRRLWSQILEQNHGEVQRALRLLVRSLSTPPGER
jgi:prephenate dehydrogenase